MNSAGKVLTFWRGSIMPFLTWGLATVLLASPAAFALQGQPDDNRTLRRGLSNLPGSLDPQQHKTTNDSLLAIELFAGLVRLDPKGRVVADTASHWQVSEDGQVYRFFLRKDARWSDGQPLIAEDYALAYQRILQGGQGTPMLFRSGLVSQPADSKAKMPGMFALSETELEIRLSAATGELLYWLTDTEAMPVPSHLYKHMGDEWVAKRPFVSNGPYTLQSFSPHLIQLTKNPLYHAAEEVGIEHVRYEILPANLSMGRYIAQTQADIATDLAYYQLQSAGRMAGYRVIRQLNNALLMFYLNPQVEGLTDIRVRQALNLAMDRQLMVNMRQKGEQAMFGLVPEQADYPSEPEPAQTYPQMLAQAKQLMSEAGYSHQQPLKLELLTSDRDLSIKDSAMAIRIWAELPIEFTLNKQPFSQVVKRIYAGDFQVVRRIWQTNHGDPLGMLQIYLPQFAPLLYPTADAHIEQLLALCRSEPQHRFQHIKALERYLLQQVPSVPVLQNAKFQLVSKRVAGWSDNSLARNESRWLTLKDGDQSSTLNEVVRPVGH